VIAKTVYKGGINTITEKLNLLASHGLIRLDRLVKQGGGFLAMEL
jgi:hypothetical protein